MQEEVAVVVVEVAVEVVGKVMVEGLVKVVVLGLVLAWVVIMEGVVAEEEEGVEVEAVQEDRVMVVVMV